VSEEDLTGYNQLRERKIGDRQYELVSRGQCSCCGEHVLEIWRWSGASVSRYRMKQHFDQENFDAYVESLDEQFLQSSADILEDYYRELQKVNSPEGIEADYSVEFRLMEYGRQRVL
jgi:hypothetical protein